MRLKRFAATGFAATGFAALGFAALALECMAQAPPCSLEENARLGGEFACVSSNGQIAIVSVANRLLVMDVSDPTDPVEVGRLEGLEGIGNHRMAGSLALVFVDDSLRVIDLENPALPTVVGSVTPIGGRVSHDRPGVDGTVAYIAYPGSPTTIVSVDFSDPTNPVVLNTLDLPDSNMAYISADSGVVGCTITDFGTANQIYFIDSSDPAELKVASRIDPTLYSEDIACCGAIACVLVQFGIAIYDTSDPYKPTQIGGATTFAWFNVEVELSPDTLFACIGYDLVGGALHAFDMKSPSLPMPLGAPIRSTYAAPRSVTPSGHGAIMLADSALLAVEAYPNLAVVGTSASEGAITDVALEGDRLLLASNSGMHIYDVSDPQSPVKTGEMYSYTNIGPRLCAQGDLAFFVRGSTLSIYDVSAPGGPALISSTRIPCLSGFDVDGTVGIGVCSSSTRAVVIDLSDPMQPVVSTALSLPTFAYPDDVAIEGNIAIVAAGSLYVVDVSDPASPRILSSLLSRTEQVALVNGIAYVSAVGSSGSVIDLSDPTEPIVLGNFTIRGVTDLDVGDNMLYATVHGSPTGLWVFDVTDPHSPDLIGSFNAPYQARAIAADDTGRVALARDGYGLSLLKACRPCYPDCTQTTGLGVLDLYDFLCWQGFFVMGDPYACDCDTTTGPSVCDVFDFLCFQDAFVGGCP